MYLLIIVKTMNHGILASVGFSLSVLSYPSVMISMPTISELHVQQHTLALYYLSCDRSDEANLDWLVQIGNGDKLVTSARFRCRDCGEIVEKQVRSIRSRLEVRIRSTCISDMPKNSLKSQCRLDCIKSRDFILVYRERCQRN